MDTKLIKYSYAPVPTIEAFAQDNSFIRGLQGAFGSGKSSGSVIELVNRAQAQRRSPDGIRHSRWAVVRNSFPELRDTTIKTVFQWLPPQYFGRYVETKHSYTIKAFEGLDMEILFLALDRPDDIKKLLSLEITGAWVNEAREVPWSVIEALQGRVGRWPPQRDGGASWHGIWMDTNPPDSDSKWYRFFEESKHPPGFARIFKQPSGLADNAENLENLPGGRRYYTNLATGKAPEWVKVYVHGEYGFVVEGKLVYPEYSDAIHCRAVEPQEGLTVIRSFDWGLTPACIFSQLLPDGRWLVFDEMTSDNMSADQFGDEVVEHCTRAFRGRATFEDWGDPAGANRAETDKRSVFEILQAKGIDVQPAITQEPMLRQEAVRRPLRTLTGGEPQFILHPRCKMLRKGFMGGYHRRRMQVAGPERYSEKAEKNQYSHCFPAGTMVLTPEGSRPIEALRPGDWVHTPNGHRQIIATMNRVTEALGRMATIKGRSFLCTPDHPVWSGCSFVRADSLQYGDDLQGALSWADHPNIPSRNSTGSRTTASPWATTNQTTCEMVASTCTGMSGATTTAKFQRITTSIMRTVTAPITRLRTYASCIKAITQPCTAGNALRPIPKARALTWRLSAPWHPYGMDQKKGWRGIANTAWSRLRDVLPMITSAFDAEGPIALSVGGARLAIAPQHARALLVARGATTTRNASAPSAPRPSSSAGSPEPRPVADRVASWRLFDEPVSVRVYDITVDEAHCFYANGILVGNCHDALQYGMVQYFAPALTNKNDGEDEEWGPQEDYAADSTRSSVTGY